VLVYAVINESAVSSPLGDAVETFVRRDDAERFVEDVRRDDIQLAAHVRIEERELQTGGRNHCLDTLRRGHSVDAPAVFVVPSSLHY